MISWTTGAHKRRESAAPARGGIGMIPSGYRRDAWGRGLISARFRPSKGRSSIVLAMLGACPLARGSARSAVPRQAAPLTATARADEARSAGTRSASCRASAGVRPASGGPNQERRRGERLANRLASGWVKQERPRRGRPRRGGRRHRSRGSHRAMWVAPSSIGCSSLTRRQRTQFGPNSGAAILRFR